MVIRFICGTLLAATLAACGQYDVSVNDRVMYTPRPLFTDFAAPDPALQACLEDAIRYHKASSALQLQELNCAGKGVADLRGLETFTGLRRLYLGDNGLGSLAPLSSLSSLELLVLRDNQITDALPLYDLLSLRVVDLRGNSGLHCPRPQDLFRVVELSLPAHCDS